MSKKKGAGKKATRKRDTSRKRASREPTSDVGGRGSGRRRLRGPSHRLGLPIDDHYIEWCFDGIPTPLLADIRTVTRKGQQAFQIRQWDLDGHSADPIYRLETPQDPKHKYDHATGSRPPRTHERCAASLLDPW